VIVATIMVILEPGKDEDEIDSVELEGICLAVIRFNSMLQKLLHPQK
jgi:hypothetical protein